MDLRRVSNAVLAAAKSRIEERQLRSACQAHPDLPMIMADEEKITWVITQLLDNAVKFTPAGGEILIKLETDSKLVTFSIIDSGIGIHPSRHHEVFEPFHQLDGSSTRRYGGTGLGLALVKKIIEAHGASVKLLSDEGKGSTFTFQLPAAA